ncbi:hypothetical protein NMD65_16515 [Edwardsiella tarda]|uniref:hypothetical protein n=1 Tax=Edwardsiella tarda TaxID=636 RepID=UPI00351C0AFA
MRNVPVLLAYTVHGDLEEAERRVSLLNDVINRWYGDAPSLYVDKLAVRMSTLLFELRCALSGCLPALSAFLAPWIVSLRMPIQWCCMPTS